MAEIVEDSSDCKHNYTNGWNDAVDRVWNWISEETEVDMYGINWNELKKEIMGLKISHKEDW